MKERGLIDRAILGGMVQAVHDWRFYQYRGMDRRVFHIRQAYLRLAGLPAFREAAEMARHAAFFKADRLPAIRTGLSKQAILIFLVSFVVFIILISLF